MLSVMSRGWNLFVKLCGTITTAQLLSAHKLAIASLSCPLNMSIINYIWTSWHPVLWHTLFRLTKTILLNKLSDFSVFDQWFSEKVMSNVAGKSYFEFDRNYPDIEIENGTVPFTGIVLTPFRSNIYLPGVT